MISLPVTEVGSRTGMVTWPPGAPVAAVGKVTATALGLVVDSTITATGTK